MIPGHPALTRANEIRDARAILRRRLRALPYSQARALLAVHVLDTPDWLDSIPVHALLGWAPYHGPLAVGKLLRFAQIRDARRLVDLTDRQRHALATALGHGSQG